MTGFESVKLRDPVSVVKVQSKKSPEVMVITADILRANGFADEAQTLIGEWASPHPLAFYVQWSFVTDCMRSGGSGALYSQLHTQQSQCVGMATEASAQRSPLTRLGFASTKCTCMLHV